MLAGGSIKKVILIGTYHSYQCGTRGGRAAADFRDSLRSLAVAESAKAIAEEMCQGGLIEYGVSETLGAEICRELGITSRLCDEIPGGREALPPYKGVLLEFVRGGGMSAQEVFQANQNAKFEFRQRAREQFWLTEILQLNMWPLIFICGADHYSYLDRIFSANHLTVVPGHLDWKPNCP